MNGTWTKKWQKCLIWFSSYISFIAFALVGGYMVVKTDDEDLHKTTKKAFVVCLIFAALNALVTLYSNFAGMSDRYYGSVAYDIYDIASRLVNVAEIIVYAVLMALDFFKKENSEND